MVFAWRQSPLCMCAHALYPENSGLSANSWASHELRKLRRQEKHARRAESASNTSAQVCMPRPWPSSKLSIKFKCKQVRLVSATSKPIHGLSFPYHSLAKKLLQHLTTIVDFLFWVSEVLWFARMQPLLQRDQMWPLNADVAASSHRPRLWQNYWEWT